MATDCLKHQKPNLERTKGFIKDIEIDFDMLLPPILSYAVPDLHTPGIMGRNEL
jgi:hypothetical protein